MTPQKLYEHHSTIVSRGLNGTLNSAVDLNFSSPGGEQEILAESLRYLRRVFQYLIS